MESKLGNILGGAEQSEAELQEALRKKRQEAVKAIAQIQKDLLNGKEGTGNQLHDNLILMYGDWLLDGSIIERFEKVQSDLKGKVGEPVVVIRRELEDVEHCSGFGTYRKPRQSVTETMAVGVLDDDNLAFESNGRRLAAFLPTSKYILRRDSYPARPENIQEGKLAVDEGSHFGIGFSLGLELDRELNLKDANLLMLLDSYEKKRMELIVGYKLIDAWLREPKQRFSRGDAYFGRVRQYCNDLGIQPIKPATEAQKQELRERMGGIKY